MAHRHEPGDRGPHAPYRRIFARSTSLSLLLSVALSVDVPPRRRRRISLFWVLAGDRVIGGCCARPGRGTPACVSQWSGLPGWVMIWAGRRPGESLAGLRARAAPAGQILPTAGVGCLWGALRPAAGGGARGAGALRPGSRAGPGWSAEGGEVDDRAADEGRGDLERALAGGDRG